MDPFGLDAFTMGDFDPAALVTQFNTDNSNVSHSSEPGSADVADLVFRLVNELCAAKKQVEEERNRRIQSENELQRLLPLSSKLETTAETTAEVAAETTETTAEVSSAASNFGSSPTVIHGSYSLLSHDWFGLDNSKVRLTPVKHSNLPRAQHIDDCFDASLEPPRLNLLEALNIRDPSDEMRVVTVRKVHKLGFRSAVFLRQYFSRYGHVEDVVLLPMRSRPKPNLDGSVRGNRPSSMGFVVMGSEAAATAALTAPVQEIRGWPIEVRPFIRPLDKPDHFKNADDSYFH